MDEHDDIEAIPLVLSLNDHSVQKQGSQDFFSRLVW
jgi:hypothetical protein